MRPQTGRQATQALRQITSELEPAVAASRKLLLGTRRLDGTSCVRLPDVAELKRGPAWLRSRPGGGPGTELLAFCRDNWRFSSAKKGFLWQQTVLRNKLAEMASRSQAASARIGLLSREASRLARSAETWAKVPDGLVPVKVAEAGHWPGTCLRSLNDAIAARDLAATRRWAGELASALFALADLHRWLEFLTANHIASLGFQAKCEEMFSWVDDAAHTAGLTFSSSRAYDRFPSSAMVLSTSQNLLEVERQAERLFGDPKAFGKATEKSPAAVPAAIWVPPDLRKDFASLRSCLSPANRKSWDRAASSPFDRSYLVNILHRMSTAKVIDSLGTVLRRFDKLYPRAETADLMDVMFYRGEMCGGMVWGDRFDPRLLRAAGHMKGDKQQVLRRAHSLTHTVLGRWEDYQGHIWTLGEALDLQKLDCVRGTDMIGSLYRNAGRSGFYSVHLSCGLASHSMGAAETGTDGVRVMSITDSLTKQMGPSVWPSAYFHGVTWPKGYPGPRAPVFTAELYVRGLDNYVLAEAYIVRGRHAGQLVHFEVPYLPGREHADAERVFGGPYPPMPDPGTVTVVTGAAPGGTTRAAPGNHRPARSPNTMLLPSK